MVTKYKKSQVRQSRVCRLLSMWISSIWGPLSFCSNRFMSSPLTYNHTDEKTSNPSPIVLGLGLGTHPEGASERRGGPGSVTAVHHQGVAWGKKSLRGIWTTFTGVKKLNQYFCLRKECVASVCSTYSSPYKYFLQNKTVWNELKHHSPSRVMTRSQTFVLSLLTFITTNQITSVGWNLAAAAAAMNWASPPLVFRFAYRGIHLSVP